ncbi:hypothetical protein RSOLAG1IB_10155 [Rhizoctonia solani AG-1 IB]|uniref:Uncharacterized protein n=1 Tax=Thanatephorus cucumeris (strain AG1-IB / isolate 7/3/14) TaxID=1108050 RepID=M5BZG4_THACB|nr:hypothetical protein BN14_06669 [Rhizoctonia solani AG-1 IB]CEL62042.1 hypothetical protein RSOLAG1IB_10155 [Rhizoctonia solani AG-1 IB]
MSSTSTPIPTPSFDPNPAQPLWVPPNRGVYTYSFLGGMALITFIVLIFVVRAYTRRRRFAARVQRALDSGRLDPALVQEIRNLPSGALYFTPSSKRKLRIRPVMHEVYLGHSENKGFNFSGDDGIGGHEKVEGTLDWRKITPIAVSKFIPKTENQVQATLPAEPEPTPGRSRFNFMSSILSSSRTEPTTPPEMSTSSTPPTVQAPPATPPPGSLALSVFIAMPSPSSRLSRAKLDGEEVVPDVCLGVTRVDITT